MKMTRGQFINPLDIEEERKVVVLGSKLLGSTTSDDPIGTYGRSTPSTFRWLGPTTSDHGDQGERQSSLHVPRTTYLKTSTKAIA